MRRRPFLPVLALPVLVAACGNPVHSHYSVKATAPCLTKLGYAVDTNSDKLGVIESAAPEGALRASEPGNNVTIDFAQDASGASAIARAYHRFGPKKRRKHINDVLEMQHNAVLVWEITPPPVELQRVLGCLK
jgi:hypothetical protein